MSELQPTTPFPEVWNVPIRHASYFVGREQEEQTVIDRLEQDGVATISGEIGMGKTQLAAEIAYRQRGGYDGVIWVNSAQGAHDSCASIVRSQALSGQNPVQEIDDLLESRGGKRLWILDDATEMPAELNAPNSNRHVLMTGMGLQAPNVTLGPLAEEQGAEVILRRAGPLKVGQQLTEASPDLLENAKRIATALDGNPYYLVRAGKYIEETGCGVARLASYLGNEKSRESVMRSLEQMS